MASRRCGCASDQCSCVIQQGAGIEVSGSGVPSNPYVIEATVEVTYTTATRPAPGSVSPGQMIFDTTLGKPLWSKGSAWVDATGATVA